MRTFNPLRRTWLPLACVSCLLLFSPPGKAQESAFPRRVPFAGGMLPQPGPRIGVTIADLDNATLARERNLSGGVLLKSVEQGSPAERYGLRPGDIIVEFGGERVRSAQQFTRLVEESVPDRELKVMVVRGGQQMELRLAPQIAQPAHRLPAPGSEEWGEEFPQDYGWFPAPRGRLGLAVQPLTPQLESFFGVREGVLVASVQEGSVGARAGLKAGDVLTALNGHPVRSRRDILRELQSIADDRDFTLTITRDRKTMTLSGRLGGQAAGGPQGGLSL